MTKFSRFLVTGANGFIGSRLCHTLKQQNCEVTAVLRKPANGPWDKAIICDLAKEQLSLDALTNIEAICHLAGIAHTNNKDTDSYYQVNTIATQKLLQQAASSNVAAFLFLSSIKATHNPGYAVDETYTKWPADHYGLSKRHAEQFVLQAPSKLHTCILRPALVYGPNAKGNLARMLRAINNGWFPPLPETNNQRSLIHVDDLISAMLTAIQHPNANRKIFIVSEKKCYSTRQIYVTMRHHLNLTTELWRLPKWLVLIIAKIVSLFGISVGSQLLGNCHFFSNSLCQQLQWQPTRNFLTDFEG